MRVTEAYLAQRKQDIARVAMRMYCEVGRDVSMAAICQEAHIAKGTIFRYFPTREAMFAEIYQSCRTHAEELAAQGVTAGATDEETLRRLIRQAFFWPVNFPLEFQFVTMYTDTNSFYIFRDAGFAAERFDALDDQRFAEVVRRNVRPDLPWEYARRALSSLINTAARYLISHGDETDGAQTDAMATSVYDAVFVRPGA